MGFFDDIIKETKKTIDDVEYSDDRDQDLLDRFTKNRRDLEDARDGAHGKDKNILESLLNLFNRKGKENDMENW